MKRIGSIICILLCMDLLSLFGCGCTYSDQEDALSAKPVIYLYPETETAVSVKLDYAGELTASYPTYADGWVVTAQPDGTLTDEDGREYSYLFWEGVSHTDWDFSHGFCVAGTDTADFLRETLSDIGLTPREYNEMIVYWLPRMQDNPYNLIAFQSERYEETARLTVVPAPNSALRVFMAYRPLCEPVEIEPQTFPPFERKGFTLVEWGGAMLRE